MGNRASLRWAIKHPRRSVAVITGTFLLGLGTILPLADEYRGLMDRNENLRNELQQSEAEATLLDRFEKRVELSQIELARLEEKTVSEERTNEFRGLVVEIVRNSGCQVRRIHVGATQSRPWMKKDSALKKRTIGNKKNETPYTLNSQSFVLEVTGTVTRLKNLLSELHEELNLAHTHSVMIRPMGQDGHEVEMQMELTLFDLERTQEPHPI